MTTDELLLEDDVYCKTFYLFLKTSNTQVHGQFFSKVMLTCGTQAGLISLLYIEMTRKENLNWSEPCKLSVIIARIICCLLLHVQIIPEINSALGMMRYALDNADEFVYCQRLKKERNMLTAKDN